MAKKTILLIEDDHETENAVREILGIEYNLETAEDGKAAAAFLKKKAPDLVLIDFDLKKEDGLEVFKKLQLSARVIMLSASGNIPLAVSATKLGVWEFLRKPVNAEQLKIAVEKNIAREEIKLRWIEGLEWLRGGSPKLKKMFSDISCALQGTNDILLIGERGIPAEKVAEFINANSPRKNRRLIKIDMSSFRKESLEPHFWASVQEFMAVPEGSSVQNEKDRCGTLYLENVCSLNEHFRSAVFNFFKERKGKIDKSIRVIFGFYDKKIIPKDYALVEVPPLRERKEDIPHLLEFYLKRYSTKYNKRVKFVSSLLLEFLAAYDYPGNYLELERMIQEAVLKSSGENLELKDFPLDFLGVLQTSLKEGAAENLTLEEAKRRFEKDLYHLVLTKSGGDSSKAAGFLHIPKSALAERLKDLVD